MSRPQLVNLSATVVCDCGEEHEFNDIGDGWQYIEPCDCGRRVSIQVGDPIVQYDRQLQAVKG